MEGWPGPELAESELSKVKAQSSGDLNSNHPGVLSNILCKQFSTLTIYFLEICNFLYVA